MAQDTGEDAGNVRLSYRFAVGVSMPSERERIEGVSVFRRLMPVIGLVWVMAGAVVFAGPTLSQTNIDQGKPASELFVNYCAVCHKSTRGLANGRSSLTLSLFLREHYATSSQQAAALAAYVISAGGNAPAAKPERAKSEEPKGQEAKGQEAKGRETKPRATSAKSEPEKPAPGGQPEREETTSVPQERAPVVATPATGASPSSGETPESGPTTSAGVSAESQSNDNALVPRDNIPD
jgi:outer membrane biosynthesis protein TonB